MGDGTFTSAAGLRFPGLLVGHICGVDDDEQGPGHDPAAYACEGGSERLRGLYLKRRAGDGGPEVKERLQPVLALWAVVASHQVAQGMPVGGIVQPDDQLGRQALWTGAQTRSLSDP